MSFFKDQDGAQAVLFGDEKVILANFVLDHDGSLYAGVLLGEPTKSMIVVPAEDICGINTMEVNTKIRLCFDDVESIDTLIDALKRAKRMISDRIISKALKSDLN